MRSRTFADFVASARQIEVEGVTVRHLSPEALIELKSPSSREKAQFDVAALRRIIAEEAEPGRVHLNALTPRTGGPPEVS